MSSMLTIELRLLAHSSRSDLSAEYSDARGSAKAGAMLVVEEWFSGIHMHGGLRTPPMMLLEQQMIVNGLDWRNSFGITKAVSERKMIIYNILKAVPMQPHLPGTPLSVPSHLELEAAFDRVMGDCLKVKQADQAAKLAAQPAAQQSSRASKPMSLDGMRRSLTGNAGAFERDYLGWNTAEQAMHAARWPQQPPSS